MAGIHITDIESAINLWRDRSPSSDGVAACYEVRALAEVYALMVYFHETECDEDSMPKKAREAWLRWYDTTPDAPCIAICSTSQGDDTCKGCGRSFDEVQNWTVMTPAEKRHTWRRITIDGTAWRFNRYAERAVKSGGAFAGAATELPSNSERSNSERSGGEPTAQPADALDSGRSTVPAAEDTAHTATEALLDATP